MLSCNSINALDICLDIKLALAAVVVHVSDFAKHCSLCPALHESDKSVSIISRVEVTFRRQVESYLPHNSTYLIMNARTTPHAAHIAVGVSTIDFVFIIEMDRKLNCLLRTLSPFQDLHANSNMTRRIMLEDQAGTRASQL